MARGFVPRKVTSKAIFMKAEYLQPFINSAVSTFDSMLGCKLVPQEPFVKGDAKIEHEVSGIIGLSGKARGAVVLTLSREAALSATEAMLGERPADINHDVADAVGELTNIIAGVAKAQLEHLALGISLPAVIIGKGHAMEFPHKAASVCIPYQCPWGYVAVEVGLFEQPEARTENK